MIIASIILAFISFSIFLFFELKHKYLTAFFFKALASFSFVLILLSILYYNWWVNYTLFLGYLSPEHLGFAYLILLGLVCGLLGDLILALRPFHEHSRHHSIILAGTVAFAVGHLFYLMALLKYMDFSWLAILFSAVITSMVFLIGIPVLKLKFQKLLIPSIIYSFLLFLMIGMTIFGFNEFDNGSFSVVILISAILFGLSDLVLSQIYFAGKEINIYKAINLSMYYLAQIGIASSLIFLV